MTPAELERHRARWRAYYAENREERKAYQRKYYREHYDECAIVCANEEDAQTVFSHIYRDMLQEP